MSASPEPVGTLAVALSHCAQLLERDPAQAAEQALEILKVVRDHPAATLLLGVAQRRSGNAALAVHTLRTLADKHSQWALAHYELALSLAQTRQGDAAIESLRRAVAVKPDMADAWRALGDHLIAANDSAGADAAYAQHILHSTTDPQLMKAGAALVENRIAVAEKLLREQLSQHPTDVPAMRMLAEVAGRLGRYADAEVLLKRSLELAPSFAAARHNLAIVLHRQNRFGEALRELEALLANDPHNPSYRNLKAALLGRIGEYDQSMAIYADVLKEYPGNAKVWLSYGHSLKTAGHQEECLKTYRQSIALAPNLGEAYWSLANLKTFPFEPDEIEAMRAQLKRDDLSAEDRFHFHFALGKAFEDAGEFEASFKHYSEGNTLRRSLIQYDANETTSHVRRSKQLFTPDFFAQRKGWGCPAADPIFIVGLPRAGSTLLEQILASHPLVEGTMELPDIISFARELGGRRLRGETSKYPEAIADLDETQMRALGERYLEQTRIQRKTDAPYFIDKMPNNFAHIGLIQSILPNAKIIDARRHPLGCCLSGFKQHFARGQHFTYDLEDIGRYYYDYVELMSHFDAVLPGRVHRVIYEHLVDDFERHVHSLLDYCGLPFDERCLRFHENDRAVRTASSEQVRRPIYREGVDHWRQYDTWLDPLKRHLGSVLELYPTVPQFKSE